MKRKHIIVVEVTTKDKYSERDARALVELALDRGHYYSDLVRNQVTKFGRPKVLRRIVSAYKGQK